MQFSEDHFQLLDIIREMIDIELDRCGMCSENDPHPEIPPPEGTGREPPDWNPSPKEPPFVIVEPWKREPTPEELLREFEDNRHLKPLIPLPILVDCVKQRNALIAFYNEANGKQWRRQDNWCNKNVNLEELSHNNIYCGRLEDNGCISARIGNLVDLEVLNLSYNFIHGRIPENLWKLTRLRRVQLDHNHLTGTIPESIGKLTQLKEFYAYGNQLYGVIPAEVKNNPNYENWEILLLNTPTFPKNFLFFLYTYKLAA